MTTITIDTLDHDGRFNAYVAEPAGTPTAAIIVIQEVFGVNAGIRSKCDALAANGYLAIAPELPGCKSDGDTPHETLENAYDAIACWIEAAQELGRQIPLPRRAAA